MLEGTVDPGNKGKSARADAGVAAASHQQQVEDNGSDALLVEPAPAFNHAAPAFLVYESFWSSYEKSANILKDMTDNKVSQSAIIHQSALLNTHPRPVDPLMICVLSDCRAAKTMQRSAGFTPFFGQWRCSP